jgi:hypothetical protein
MKRKNPPSGLSYVVKEIGAGLGLGQIILDSFNHLPVFQCAKLCLALSRADPVFIA